MVPNIKILHHELQFYKLLIFYIIKIQLLNLLDVYYHNLNN